MMRTTKTSVRYKLYQVPLFLTWLLSLTHCAGNMEGAANINEGFSSSNTSALASNGAYQIINVKSGLALDLQQAGTVNGNPVITNEPNNALSQQWSLRLDSSGAYSIINAQTQQALDVYDGLSTPGTPMQAWGDFQTANQQFHVNSEGNNIYQIVSVLSSECLDLTSGAVSPGTRAQQWTCANGSDEMLWQLVAPGNNAGNSNAVASTDSNSNSVTQPNATTTAAGTGTGSSSYTLAQLTADMNNVLQERSPIYSNRNLGNPANIAMWTPAELQSLFNGIITAHDVFYTNISLSDLAHLIIAEGAQESTGNYDLQGWSEGFIQSTPSTVGNDYINHGLAITSPMGTMLSPSQAINYYDPGQNVTSWAWYTYNVVVAGESMNEVAQGDPQGGVTRDFGNAEFDWLAGPHNDRHNAAQASNYKDYHDRIEDYFVQSGFGTAEYFENLLNTPLGTTLIDEH